MGTCSLFRLVLDWQIIGYTSTLLNGVKPILMSGMALSWLGHVQVSVIAATMIFAVTSDSSFHDKRT